MKCKNCGNIEPDDSTFCSKCKTLIFDAELYFERYIKSNNPNDDQKAETQYSSISPKEKGISPNNSWVETPTERDLRLNGGNSSPNNAPHTKTSEKPNTPFNPQPDKTQKTGLQEIKTRSIHPLQTGKAEFNFNSASEREIELNQSTITTQDKTHKPPPTHKNNDINSHQKAQPYESQQNRKPEKPGAIGISIFIISAIFILLGKSIGVNRILIIGVAFCAFFAAFLLYEANKCGIQERIGKALFKACKFSLALLIILGSLKSCSNGGSEGSGVDYECEYGIGGTPICKPKY